jgi:hypothetical protein
MIRNAKSILGTVSILAMVGVSGCSSAPSTSNAAPPPRSTAKTVSPVMHVLTTPKVQITSSQVIGVIGSYTGCTGQSATQWVLDTGGNAGVMEGKTGLVAPTIELDDANCVLSITTISSSSDGYTVDKSSSLPFTGPGVAANAYLATAAAFDDPNNGGALGFYANAQSTITNGTANFSVTLLLGDDPNIGSTSTTALAQTVTGSLSVSDVLPPTYTTDLTAFTLDDDVSGIASTESGTITLDSGAQAGQNYQIFHGQDLSTDDFAQIDAAWNANITNNIGMSAGNVSVNPASLVIAGPPGTGDQLPLTSTIVIQNVVSGVPAYQLIAITFNSHLGS